MGADINPFTGDLILFPNSSGGSTATFKTFQVPNGTSPVAVTSADVLTWTSTGSTITITGNASTDTINCDINASGVSMGGDLSGTVAAANVAKIQGHAVDSTAPTDAQLLVWVNGSAKYIPRSVGGDATMDATGAMTVTKTSGTTFAASATTDATKSNNVKTTVATKTANYTLTSTDGIVIADATGGAFTLTLPKASTVSGQIFHLWRKDSNPGTAVTIALDATVPDTIQYGSTSYKLYTKGECYALLADGANNNWIILRHDTATAPASLTLTASMTTNTTVTAQWFREQHRMRIQGRITFAGAPNAVTLTFTVPFSLSIDTTISALQFLTEYGSIDTTDTTHFYTGKINYNNSTSVVAQTQFSNPVNLEALNATQPIAIGATTVINFDFAIPISGWNE